jgi:hypothetical protein
MADIKLQQNQACENLADYSDTNIPVTVELDVANSILEPTDGQLQTFCYTMTQVAVPTALSHWLLGICPELTINDLTNITVTINGMMQTVVTTGEEPNVEIRTEENPDPTTGCTGLKFDFGLMNAGDVMEVCFSLLEPLPIGPNVVCLKGGQFVENNMSVCGPICAAEEQCPVTVFQQVGVCVPITITPFANVGTINITCCGTPTVSTTPCGTGPRSCTFFVRQNLCAEVPITFGANGEPGEAVVSCGTPSEEPCDCDNNDDGNGGIG